MPKIFDVLLGRTKPVQADLDALFGLVGAQITLQAGESLLPSGQAAVCFKPVAGRSFAETAAEANELLGLGTGAPAEASGAPSAPAASLPAPAAEPAFRQKDDEYGFHWIIFDVADFQELVNQVHLVNSTLQDNGYGPQLLCSVFAFHPDPAAPPQTGTPPILYLVYLYKRGSFYPFIPLAGGDQRRDVEAELKFQNVLSDDLKIEPDKERWMALWGLPVH